MFLAIYPVIKIVNWLHVCLLDSGGLSSPLLLLQRHRIFHLQQRCYLPSSTTYTCRTPQWDTTIQPGPNLQANHKGPASPALCRGVGRMKELTFTLFTAADGAQHVITRHYHQRQWKYSCYHPSSIVLLFKKQKRHPDFRGVPSLG